VLLAQAVANVASPGWPEESDAPVYWEAAERLRAGGARLYDDPERAPSYFIYPPAFAAGFAPLTALPVRLGRLAWELISLASLAVAAFVLVRACGVERGRRASFLAAVVAATWGALWMNTFNEQVGGLLLAIVALGLHLARGSQAWRGGVLIGLAVHLKVVPVVLLPVLALRRAWGALAGVGVGFVLGVLLPFAAAAPRLGVGDAGRADVAMHRRYLTEVVTPRLVGQDAPRLGDARVPNNSLAAVARRLFHAREPLSFYSDERGPLLVALPTRRLRWFGLAAAGLLYLVALAVVARRRQDSLDYAGAGLALTAADLGNPLSWPHHLWVLALVVAPLAATPKAGGRALGLGLGAVSTLAYLPLLVYLPPFAGLLPLGPSERFQAWGFPTLGILVLWSVACRRAWRLPRA
jgi:hypothetical protein